MKWKIALFPGVAALTALHRVKRHVRFFAIVAGVIGFLGFGSRAYAYDKCTSRVSLTVANMQASANLTVGPDAPTLGTPLTDWTSSPKVDLYDCEATSLHMGHGLYATASKTSIVGAEYSEAGSRYPIFATPISGIGVIVRFQSTHIDVTVGLFNYGIVTVYGNSSGPVVGSLIISTRLIATGAALPAGSHSIPGTKMATFKFDTGVATPIDLYLAGTQVNVTANTCLAALPSQGVDLVKRDAAVFDRKGKLEKAREFEIALNCSGSGGPFDLYATFTDVQSPSNLGTDITLAPGSAKGLGLQLWKEGKALRMGPDSRSPTNPNRWYVGKVNGTVNIPLEAWYVQTGDAVEPGPVNAAVTYTLSYP